MLFFLRMLEKPPRAISAPPEQSGSPSGRSASPAAGGSEAEGPEIDAGPLRYHPGDRIADKYRLVELLGEGGMGAVWRAHNTVLDADVAVKLLHVDGNDPLSLIHI